MSLTPCCCHIPCPSDIIDYPSIRRSFCCPRLFPLTPGSATCHYSSVHCLTVIPPVPFISPCRTVIPSVPFISLPHRYSPCPFHPTVAPLFPLSPSCLAVARFSPYPLRIPVAPLFPLSSSYHCRTVIPPILFLSLPHRYSPYPLLITAAPLFPLSHSFHCRTFL